MIKSAKVIPPTKFQFEREFSKSSYKLILQSFVIN